MNKETAKQRRTRILLTLTVSLLFLPVGIASGFEKISTREGMVLFREKPHPDKNIDANESVAAEIRDLFSWSPEVAAQFQNPVMGKEGENPQAADLHLSGILWDEVEPLAIIEDTLLKEGEFIEGALVRAIFPDEVLLERGDDHFTLRFQELFELESVELSSSRIKGSTP